MDRRRRVRAGGTPADPFDRACRPPAPGRGRGRALPARDRAGLGGGSARASGIDPGAKRAPLASQPARGRVPPTRSRARCAACSSPRPGSASLQRPCSSSPRRTATPSWRRSGCRPRSPRELLGLPPGGGKARAVALAYRYSEEEARDEFRLSGGLALPVLDRDGGRLGTLAVFSRRVEREVTEEELERLEGLAGALGPSLRNAFRFEELRRTSTGTSLGSWAGARSAKPSPSSARGRAAMRIRSACFSFARPAGRRASGRRRTGSPGACARPTASTTSATGASPSSFRSRRSRRRAPRAQAPPLARRAGRPPRSSSFASRTTPSRCSSAASPRSPVQRPSPRPPKPAKAVEPGG